MCVQANQSKQKQNSYSNMIAMRINVIFGLSNVNSSSAETERSHQPGHSQLLSKLLILKFKKQLATWQLKKSLKENIKENTLMAVEKIRKERKKHWKDKYREELEDTEEFKIVRLL